MNTQILNKQLEPFWHNSNITGEAILPIVKKGQDYAGAKLLLNPQKILRIYNPQTGFEYKVEKDYIITETEIRLTENSRIPFLKEECIFKKPEDEKAIAHMKDNENTWLFWEEDGFAPYQSEVDYVSPQKWEGYIPDSAKQPLPLFCEKLSQAQPVNISFIGDSITAGSNASRDKAPYMPRYSDLFCSQLEKQYNTKVNMQNLAVGGTTANQGMEQIEKVIEHRPDLTVIAYGMNDAGYRDADRFIRNIKQLIAEIGKKKPAQEFLVVSSSLPNPLWHYATPETILEYREHLRNLQGDRIAFLDLSQLWHEIMQRKNYYDLTGNGVNHPNDYGHRLYVQAFTELFRQ